VGQEGLNDAQQEAVEYGSGPLLVVAGAGSGKTRVITHRITQLVRGGVPPGRIAALTITNKAANEMRERVAELLGRKQAGELTLGTFHSLGLQILRRERDALGLPPGFAIYDTADQLGVIRELLRRIRDGDRRYDPSAILTRISLAKNRLELPEAYQANPADEYDGLTEDLYPRYEEALRAFGALDFDDLIVRPVRLFDENPDVRRRWRGQFEHVLVDEYQDTNRVQLRFLKELVFETRNVCAVGDDDQSIYSWRGAEATQIFQFEKDFPGARVVILDQNYRSTPAILDAANAVIVNNRERRPKKLWSARARGPLAVTVTARDAEQEARFVAREIKRLAEEESRPYSDFAVLYRSNMLARGLEESLRELEVPYRLLGGQQFYERKEVKDLLAYLRVGFNPRDEIALRRILNYPSRGIGTRTVQRIEAEARRRKTPFFRVLSSPPELAPRIEAAVRGFSALLADLRHRLDTEPAAATARSLVEEIGLFDDIRMDAPSGSAAQRRVDNVETLFRSLARYEEKHRDRKEVAQFIRRLSLESSDEGEDANAGARTVTLTTLHGAKGLEFKIVFFIGLEEQILPHARTLAPKATDVIDAESAQDIDEERRLAYVGMTRAQDVLYLMRCSHRRQRGKMVPRTPSRFLMEIPPELCTPRDLSAEEEAPVSQDALSACFSQLAD